MPVNFYTQKVIHLLNITNLQDVMKFKYVMKKQTHLPSQFPNIDSLQSKKIHSHTVERSQTLDKNKMACILTSVNSLNQLLINL